MCFKTPFLNDCMRNVCVFQGTFLMTDKNLCVSRLLSYD